MRKRLQIITALPALLGAGFFVTCAGGVRQGSEAARDRARVANDGARSQLGTTGAIGAALTGSQSSAAIAEETAARRAGVRRTMLQLRREQDRAYERRQDDASFVDAYRASGRDEAIKVYLYARALGKINKLAEARVEFEAAAAADPKNAWPHEGLGVCHYLSKQFDRAIVSLKKSVDLDPELAEAHFGLARAFQAANRPDEAIAAAESCMRTDDDPTRAPLLVADLRLARNEGEKAIAVLKGAVDRTPSEMILRLALAECYGKSGRPTDAAAQLDTAIAMGRLPPERLFTISALYRRADRFDRAIELLERLLAEASPEYWKTHPREDVEKILETVREEKKIGYRIEYNLEELCQMLRAHPDVERRKFAANALKTFPFPDVDRAYIQSLHDASGDVRVIAVAEIAKRTRELSTKALVALAKGDRDERVRAASCVALGTMDNKESREALLAGLLDSMVSVRVAANKSLESISGRIVLPLGVEGLDEPGRKAAEAQWRTLLSQYKPKLADAPDGQLLDVK